MTTPNGIESATEDDLSHYMSAVATLRAENAALREQRDEARRSRNDARLELAFFMGALSKRRAQRLYRKARAALSEVDA